MYDLSDFCLFFNITKKKNPKRNKTKQNIVNVSLQDNRITGKSCLYFLNKILFWSILKEICIYWVKFI